jgi:type III pantothenate kinase
MLLTIDIGNTNMVLGVFQGDTIVEHWRIATVPDRTADEIAALLHGLLARSTVVKESDLAGISLCSTVPSVLHEMREMVRRYYEDVPSVIVQPGVKTGVPIRMDNPKEVGSDRIMNSLAAVHLYGGPAIVVDFGTSTNFDAVSAKGEFVGGALAPGIEISVDALSRRAAQLLKVELTRPARVIGKNTVEALQSGIVYGFAGQVEGIARRMAAELSPEDPGGDRRGAGHRRARAVAHPHRPPARLGAQHGQWRSPGGHLRSGWCSGPQRCAAGGQSPVAFGRGS